MSTLTIQNLRKSYKENIVVKNVSLKIRKREKIALIGESGSGKEREQTLMPTFTQIRDK